MPDNMEVAIYLRKSRDEEQLGVAETLAKHRSVLLGMVEAMQLVLVDTYEEVVSGESLYARPEMLKLLEAVQEGKYDAVLCMDIDRLGRGGMSNQGLILDAFKYSGTKIITPDKLYDMADETDEQLLEFKTFVSRQEYRQITKRLKRGLHQVINDGGYVANAPYGYVKTVKDKKPTLDIYEPEARFVRMVYDWYCDGVGAATIALRLNALGSVPHRSGAWSRESVRYLLRNPTYCGKIVWNKKQCIRKGSRGNAQHVTIYNPEDKWLIVDGLHEPIISELQFDRVKSIRQKRFIPGKKDGTVKSPLAGLVVCSSCGKYMQRMGMSKGVEYMLCNTTGCCAGAKLELVEESILNKLREQLEKLNVELSKPDSSNVDYSAMLAALDESAERLNAQKTRLYDLLEQGVYDISVYRERMDVLAQKLMQNENERKRLKEKDARAHVKNMDLLRSRISKLLEVYYTSTAADRNAVLKSTVKKVTYTKKKKTKPSDFIVDLQYLSDIL